MNNTRAAAAVSVGEWRKRRLVYRLTLSGDTQTVRRLLHHILRVHQVLVHMSEIKQPDAGQTNFSSRKVERRSRHVPAYTCNGATCARGAGRNFRKRVQKDSGSSIPSTHVLTPTTACEELVFLLLLRRMKCKMCTCIIDKASRQNDASKRTGF